MKCGGSVPFISAASRHLMRQQEQSLRDKVEGEKSEHGDADYHGRRRALFAYPSNYTRSWH